MRWYDRVIEWIAIKLLALRDPRKYWKPFIKAADNHLADTKKRAQARETYYASLDDFVKKQKEDENAAKLAQLDEGEAQLRKELGIPKDMAPTGLMRND